MPVSDSPFSRISLFTEISEYPNEEDDFAEEDDMDEEDDFDEEFLEEVQVDGRVFQNVRCGHLYGLTFDQLFFASSLEELKTLSGGRIDDWDQRHFLEKEVCGCIACMPEQMHSPHCCHSCKRPLRDVDYNTFGNDTFICTFCDSSFFYFCKFCEEPVVLKDGELVCSSEARQI